MNYWINFASILFADAPQPTPAETPGAGNNSGGAFNPQILLFIAGFVLLMYVFMILPQRREKNRWNNMIDKMKKNDRVLMSCGIIGTVHTVYKEKNEIVIKVDDDSNTKMTFSLAAVSRVFDEPNDKK
ncbi:MAG: preprotein translocase subunit YajC [Planctomycetaceae bacterium]|jgi:preprotein translocase subunit YajC|nr:preprotein translocase subunit YajC [Planctomycetaceae bacterium]